MQKPPKRAVLFDMDGVLVQTEELKAEAHATAVRHLGGQVSPSLYERHMGRSHEAVRKAFVTRAGIAPDPNEYSRQYQEAYRDLLRDRLAVTPGVIKLLEQLSQRGYRLSLVTSSHSWMTDYVLSKTTLDRFFDTRVSVEDVEKPKPAPDAYLRALRLLSLNPEVERANEPPVPVLADRMGRPFLLRGKARSPTSAKLGFPKRRCCPARGSSCLTRPNSEPCGRPDGGQHGPGSHHR